MALLIFSHIIMILIFEVSDSLIQMFSGSSTTDMESINYEIAYLTLSKQGLVRWISLFMWMYLTGLIVVFFISYVKRFFFICVLTVFAPIFSIMHVFGRQTKQIYSSWLKEYICLVFVQPLHLIIYTVLISIPFSLLAASPEYAFDGLGAWKMIYALIAMSFIKPAEKYLRSLFGMDQGIAKVGSYDSGKQTINAVKTAIITSVKTAVKMAIKPVADASKLAKGEIDEKNIGTVAAIAVGAIAGSVVPGYGTATGAAAGATVGTTGAVVAEGTAIAAEGTAIAIEGATVAAESVSTVAEGASIAVEGVSTVAEGAAIAEEGGAAIAEGVAEGGEALAEGGEFLAEGATDSGMFDVSNGSEFETNSDDLLEKGIRKGIRKEINGSGSENEGQTISDSDNASTEYVDGNYGGDASKGLGTARGRVGLSTETLGFIDFSDSGMKEAIAQGVAQGNKKSGKTEPIQIVLNDENKKDSKENMIGTITDGVFDLVDDVYSGANEILDTLYVDGAPGDWQSTSANIKTVKGIAGEVTGLAKSIEETFEKFNKKPENLNYLNNKLGMKCSKVSEAVPNSEFYFDNGYTNVEEMMWLNNMKDRLVQTPEAVIKLDKAIKKRGKKISYNGEDETTKKLIEDINNHYGDMLE